MKDSSKVWKCPDCPWVEKAHPTYGWAKHNDHAVEIHQTMLCPNRRTYYPKDVTLPPTDSQSLDELRKVLENEDLPLTPSEEEMINVQA